MTQAPPRPRPRERRPELPAEEGWAFWSLDVEEATGRARERVAAAGPARRRPEHARARRRARIALRQLSSPIMLILLVAASIAAVTGDATDGSIIVAIVIASAGLGAWQEGRAADAVDALLDRVAVTVAVRRDGAAMRVPAADVRVLDVIELSAGDLIPADCLLVLASDLQADESALTGESFPAEKEVGPVDARAPMADRTGALFAGTHVVSGTGSAVVLLTGGDTTYGHLSSALRHTEKPTGFETGVRRFGLLLLRVMLVLVALTMTINLLLSRPLIDSLLFALALAVGITPQMLPAVVSVSLSAGARRMARERVIVKRLDAIEDLGAMNVLCSDKTGTVTTGQVELDRAVDASGSASARVLRLASLNAGLQRGYVNPIDQAIERRAPVPGDAVLLDEIPYDFQRKRLSIVTTVDGSPLLITKGAVEAVLACVSAPEGSAAENTLRQARSLAEGFGSSGKRVLAVASRRLAGDGEGGATVDPADETGMTFEGLLVLDDPVKPDAAESIEELASLGVTVKIVSGDNRHVTASLGTTLHLGGRVVTGDEIARANPADLHDLVTLNRLFAEVEPAHKLTIVRALKQAGNTVGFVGDGINDSVALHAADVGISVDMAVDVAKEAAGIVLLAQDLKVVATGVRLGRRTFANTLKYVRVASSSNFGNILSMVVAAAVLPFLPMLPAQILLLNFMADIPNTLVSRDRVDPEVIRASGTWNMHAVLRYMIAFGAVSTVFDMLTFAVLEFGFRAGPSLFHSGWFVESAFTQFIAMMTLRTTRPAWRSRPDRVFLVASALVAVVTFSLPFTPLAGVLGFVGLPPQLVVVLVALCAGYGLSNEALKRIVARRAVHARRGSRRAHSQTAAIPPTGMGSQ